MGPTNWDDSSVYYDDRYERQLKRKRSDIASFNINSSNHSSDGGLEDGQLGGGMTEDGYQMFLSHLDAFSEWRSSEREEKNGEDGTNNFTEGGMIETTIDVRGVMEGEDVATTKDLRNVMEEEKIETTNDFRNIGDSIADESYQLVMNSIEKEGGRSVFMNSSGNRLEYEEDDVEHSGDTEILVADKVPDCSEGNFTPFVVSRLFDASMEGDDEQCAKNPSKNDDSLFREEVMGILRRPYDQNEFDKLFQEVNVRKPMEGHRDLRGRTASFPNYRCSKSYLDHYSDLKRKLYAVQFDRRKMLNILRGFFYWLQNLSNEGAFKPWLDSSCLEVIPRVP